MKTFHIGSAHDGHDFEVRPGGWIALRPSADGHVHVIRGTETLDDAGDEENWTPAQEATRNNAQISDGETLYSGAGFDEDLIEGQAADVRWAFEAAGPVPTQGRLLEVGCGPGFLLERLRRDVPGCDLCGVDPSRVSVGQARSRGLDVREGTVEDLPESERFDGFVVMGNLQLHRDPEATLRAMSARANPGARLYLDSKNPQSLVRMASRTALRTPLRRLGVVHGVAAHAFHGMRHSIPKGQLASLLQRTGWSPVTIQTCSPRLLRFGNAHAHADGVRGRV